MNSAVYPEEVEHLAALFGEPRRVQVEIAADPEFYRSFKASLQRRRAEVALVILRKDGQVLVTTKSFYPAGIFRIPTGGINPGEAVQEALYREMQEETGLACESTRFAAVIEYRIICSIGAVRFASYLFVLEAPEGEPTCTDPNEEICEYREVPPSELAAISAHLSELGPSWKSWGLWRAVPHQVAGEILTPAAAVSQH